VSYSWRRKQGTGVLVLPQDIKKHILQRFAGESGSMTNELFKLIGFVFLF